MSTDETGFFNNYHDRGMKKWAGFYLSEHTAMMETLKQKEKQLFPQQAEMSAKEISQLLEHALLKSLPIAIQKRELDQEGRYKDTIIGKIQGHDSKSIYVANHKIDYNKIRHVSLHELHKWHNFN